jgi:hypothetical protein
MEMWPNHFDKNRETFIAKAIIKNNSRHLQTSISWANGNLERSLGDLFKLHLLIILIAEVVFVSVSGDRL